MGRLAPGEHTHGGRRADRQRPAMLAACARGRRAWGRRQLLLFIAGAERAAGRRLPLLPSEVVSVGDNPGKIDRYHQQQFLDQSDAPRERRTAGSVAGVCHRRGGNRAAGARRGRPRAARSDRLCGRRQRASGAAGSRHREPDLRCRALEKTHSRRRWRLTRGSWRSPAWTASGAKSWATSTSAWPRTTPLPTAACRCSSGHATSTPTAREPQRSRSTACGRTTATSSPTAPARTARSRVRATRPSASTAGSTTTRRACAPRAGRG